MSKKENGHKLNSMLKDNIVMFLEKGIVDAFNARKSHSNFLLWNFKSFLTISMNLCLIEKVNTKILCRYFFQFETNYF